MAKMPGYLATNPPKGNVITVRVRRWHPSIVPVLWHILTVQPSVLKPAVVLWAWGYLMLSGTRGR